MRISDWSSDVCSSDLEVAARPIEQDMVGHADRVGGAVARQAVHRLARDLAGKLLVQRLRLLGRQPRRAGFGAARGRTAGDQGQGENGREAWRERVCQYV